MLTNNNPLFYKLTNNNPRWRFSKPGGGNRDPITLNNTWGMWRVISFVITSHNSRLFIFCFYAPCKVFLDPSEIFLTTIPHFTFTFFLDPSEIFLPLGPHFTFTHWRSSCECEWLWYWFLGVLRKLWKVLFKPHNYHYSGNISSSFMYLPLCLLIPRALWALVLKKNWKYLEGFASFAFFNIYLLSRICFSPN